MIGLLSNTSAYVRTYLIIPLISPMKETLLYEEKRTLLFIHVFEVTWKAADANVNLAGKRKATSLDSQHIKTKNSFQ